MMPAFQDGRSFHLAEAQDLVNRFQAGSNSESSGCHLVVGLPELLVNTAALLATNPGGCCAKTNLLEADSPSLCGSTPIAVGCHRIAFVVFVDRH